MSTLPVAQLKLKPVPHSGNTRGSSAGILLSLLLIGAQIFSPTILPADSRTGDILSLTRDDRPISLNHHIIKITDRGVEPSTLVVPKDEIVIFFLNQTTDSLITLAVDFQGKTTHCATPNLTIDASGTIRTVRALAPKDFSSICFHDRGEYKIELFGVPTSPNQTTVTVTVQ